MKKIYDFSDIYKKIDIINIDILNEIFLQKEIFNNYSDLTLKDIQILFLWQTYFSLSSFCVKMGEVSNLTKINIIETSENIFELFNDTIDIMNKNYNDEKYNDSIVNMLKIAMYTNQNPYYKFIYNKKKNNLKNISKNFYYKLKNKKIKNKKYIFDNNKWLSLTFKNDNYLLPINNIFKNVDLNIRDNISKIVYKIFSKNIKKLFLIEDELINNQISILFSKYYSSILSLSLVEGFNQNINYYNKLLINSKIKSLHTCNGFLTSDYFKIFSIVAKRKGCLLVTHEHGVYNFHPIISQKKVKNMFYKIHTTLKISDYYLTWGSPNVKNKNYLDVEKYFNVKVRNAGSVYLNDIKNKVIPKKNQIKTILFIDSPFKKYNVFEYDQKFEDIFKRKNTIRELFIKILSSNPGVKIIYKPFPNAHINNPILTLVDELSYKNFEIVNSNSIDLIINSDFIILDSLSTAFAEIISLEKFFLVFGNEYELENTSDQGKIINNNLSNEKIILYNVEDIIKIVNNFFISNQNKQKLNSTIFEEFTKLSASPISRVDFLKNIADLI